MATSDQMKVAVCNLSLNKDLDALSSEYAFHWKELPLDESKMRTEIKRYQPDVIISTNEVIPTIYALTNENRPFLVVATEDSASDLPNTLAAGVADDVLLLPARKLQLVNILRWAKQMQGIRRIEGMSAGVERMVEKLEQDFALAQKIQRRLIKDRFPSISGISIKSKYWCGLRGGGDYFDVFEFGDGKHIGFLLGDVSSYALSSRFLSSLMMFSVKKDFEEHLEPSSFVRKIFLPLSEIMKDDDSFSCFYGVLDRRSFTLRFVSYGSIAVSLHSHGETLRWLNSGAATALKRDSAKIEESDVQEISLEPKDRLSIFSDGFAEGAGKDLREFYGGIKESDPQKILNEFAFALKSYQDPEGEAAISGESKLPPQDCSLMIIEVAKNILRLAQ